MFEIIQPISCYIKYLRNAYRPLKEERVVETSVCFHTKRPYCAEDIKFSN